MINLKGELRIFSKLTAHLNPPPTRQYTFTVLQKLALRDADVPEEYDAKFWGEFLDYIDEEPGVALLRQVVYLAGDTITGLNRDEAICLSRYFPAYFDPADEYTQALYDAIQEGR